MPWVVHPNRTSEYSTSHSSAQLSALQSSAPVSITHNPPAHSSLLYPIRKTPTGWDAGRYGTPLDIIAQTDRATLWNFVCIAEALNTSRITDPYKLYKYFYPSEVGTCVGSDIGGTEGVAKVFRDRREEKDIQNDILHETSVHP